MALYLCLRQDRRYLCNQTEAVRLQSRAWLCRMNAVLARYISGLARDVNNSHPHSERPQLWSRDGARWMSAMQQETASMRPNAAQTRTNARFSVVLRRAVQGSWSYRCANTDTAQPLLPSSNSVISTAREEAFAAPSSLPFIHTLDCLSCPIRHQSRREQQRVLDRPFTPIRCAGPYLCLSSQSPSPSLKARDHLIYTLPPALLEHLTLARRQNE
jgi:hypothetical protein